MKHVIILASLSLILLFGACEKDIINTTTEELVANGQVESTAALTLRNGNYKSMAELRSQLKNVITEDGEQISAAWTLDENIGLIIGKKYAIINRITGQVIKGRLSEANNFWKEAPYVSNKKTGELHHPSVEYHQSKIVKGITAGWVYGDLLGFTSKQAYWHSSIREFSNPKVWKCDDSKSGFLKDVDFWKGITDRLSPEGITAGFFAPNNLFVAFSGSKIFAHSGDRNEWILIQEIADLQPIYPFSFVKDAPLPQLSEINAAFYNEGANEYVLMSGHAWAAYNMDRKTWTTGSLSWCFDELKAEKEKFCTAVDGMVCGCDNVTYRNSCEADKFGVASYIKGKCN